MKTNKKNKSKLISGIRSHCLLVGFVFASFSNVCNSNDLLSGTDLKDSSLSLSLTSRVSITNANQQVSQLVLTQYGIYNETTVSQMADAGNTLNVLQNGMYNNANLSQVGNNNIINLEQLGNSNFAEVIQDGNANLANIKQTGEQTFTVHQIGSDMVVNITQY
ncbi:curlin subunit CsgB [Psychrosphaera sp.]|nr:curlin subunit CsgB [Psychrosphaera sp.]